MPGENAGLECVVRASLKQRIVTGVSLAVALVASVLYAPFTVIAFIFGAAILVAAWEWSRLAGYEESWARVAYAFVAGLIMLAVYKHSGFPGIPQLDMVQPILGLACLWWSIALLWVMTYPGSAAFWKTRPMLGLIGLLVLVPAWLAVIYVLHKAEGRWLLLYLFVVVAAADIGAYFAGKRFGRRKLALAVSPGKSWEGFWGGLAVCALLAIGTHYAGLASLSLEATLAVVLITALASVLGDLVESMVKRESGVKDSGTILPGHGGLLDRIDGHTAAAPVFALGIILAGL